MRLQPSQQATKAMIVLRQNNLNQGDSVFLGGQ